MMNVIVSNHILLQELPPSFARVVREWLTIENPNYTEAVKRGRWTGKIPKELTLYQSGKDGLVIPRGCALRLLAMATRSEVSWRIVDKRRLLPEVPFTFAGLLRDYQIEAVKDCLKHDFGVLDAATGSGKTTMALAIIAARKQPTLVICHTKELQEQWIDRACQFLGMKPAEIGVIGGGKMQIGERLTIGIVNSIYPVANEIKDRFGFLVVDECHHCPSRTFTEAVTAFDCRYQLGLSATPFRRDGLSKLIFWHLGDVAHSVDKSRLIEQGSILQPEIVQRKTGFVSGYDLTTDYSKGISELAMDPSRNRLIASDVVDYLRSDDGPVMVLSDRKAHCEALHGLLIIQGVKAELLTSDLNNGKRREVVERIRAGNVQAIVATGSLVGEGFDLPSLNALFLATPLKYFGRVTQYIGRVLRPSPGKDRAVIFDYVDSQEPVLAASARSRQRVYERVAA